MFTPTIIITFIVIFLAAFIFGIVQFHRLYQGNKPVPSQVLQAAFLNHSINATFGAIALTGLFANQKATVIPWVPFMAILGILWFLRTFTAKHQNNMVAKYGNSNTV